MRSPVAQMVPETSTISCSRMYASWMSASRLASARETTFWPSYICGSSETT